MAKRPGTPVRGSTTGRPIMVLLDMLGQRWTLRILWEMRSGPASFRALQARCDAISPTVLNARLKDLRALALVTLEEDGYALSRLGEQLCDQFGGLDAWANQWAKVVKPDAG